MNVIFVAFIDGFFTFIKLDWIWNNPLSFSGLQSCLRLSIPSLSFSDACFSFLFRLSIFLWFLESGLSRASWALVRNSGRCSLPYGGDLTKRPSCCRVLFVVATPCLTDGVHKEARQDRHATSVVQQPGPPIPGIPVFPYRQKTTIPVRVASNRKILTIIKNHRLAAAYIKLISQ